MTERCPLCGGESHPSPDTQPDQFGFLCPGPQASSDAQWFYLNQISGAYLALLSEAQAYVDEIARRKELWYARERTDVTPEELQDDCDTRVAERHPDGAVGHTEPFTPEEGFDVDPPHLTVPGKVPTTRRLRRPGYTKDGDAMLYMPSPQDPSGPSNPLSDAEMYPGQCLPDDHPWVRRTREGKWSEEDKDS